MLVYINGTLISADAGSLMIDDTVGQRTTCEFIVRDDAGATTFQQGQSVKVVDDSNNNSILFQGFIDNIQQTKRSYAATLSHDIQCADYHYLSDKRIAAKTYTNQTCGYIVKDLLSSYLTAEGVVAALGSNLLTLNQSDIETDTTGFSANGGATLTRDATQCWHGGSSLKCVTPNVAAFEGWYVRIPRTSLIANHTYTLSVYLQGTGTVELLAQQLSPLVTLATSSTITLTGTWTRHTLTFTTPNPLVATDYLFACYTPTQQAATIYADGLQWESNASASAWQPGGSATSMIADGATVNTAVFDYITVSDCMDQLAEYAGFWWNIDASGYLWFVPRTQVSAPFTADGTIMDDASVKVQINNPLYRNRQYIKGGMDVTSSQTETRQGDGKATAFTMSFPLAQVPTITLNGGSQTVGIKGLDSGKQWYWNKSDPVISQDSAGTKLISTDTLSVTYVGQFPIVVLAFDQSGVTSRQSIEGGTTTGYVEAVESVNNVTSSAQGFQIANARISRYSNLSGITITFDTLTYGLVPGQTLTVNLPAHNVNNVQTLIESVATHDDQSLMVPIYSIKTLVGPANTTYVQFWNALFAKTQVASNQSSIGSTNTTLAIETPFSETWTWNANESVTETVYSCPVPASTLFPSATLYPC